jgi:hypothetical protein
VAEEVAWVLGSEDLNIMAETAQAEMKKTQQQKQQQRDNDQEEGVSIERGREMSLEEREEFLASTGNIVFSKDGSNPNDLAEWLKKEGYNLSNIPWLGQEIEGYNNKERNTYTLNLFGNTKGGNEKDPFERFNNLPLDKQEKLMEAFAACYKIDQCRESLPIPAEITPSALPLLAAPAAPYIAAGVASFRACMTSGICQRAVIAVGAIYTGKTVGEQAKDIWGNNDAAKNAEDNNDIANDANNWYKNKNKEVKQSQQQKVSNTASNMPDPDDFDHGDDGEKKNKGFYENYKDRNKNELKKGIKSFDKQIELHKNKMKDPAKYNPGWENFHPDRKISLMGRWQKDVERHMEQKAILEEILKTRGN